MSPKELLVELSKYPKEVVNCALVELMAEGVMDFNTVSRAYVHYLEEKERDTHSRLVEAETCVMESFYDKKTVDKTKHKGIDYTHTQRCLHLLNSSKIFRMDILNEKYKYNEEDGRNASDYEQTRERRNNAYQYPSTSKT